ncbi:AMP-binding protein, partial [Acinetobacter nosocomialis]
PGTPLNAGDCYVMTEVKHESDKCDLVMRSIQDPFLRMFTSGTTGPAKPLEVPLKALIAFGRYMQDDIGLTEEDSFWNIADPGCEYGLYY